VSGPFRGFAQPLRGPSFRRVWISAFLSGLGDWAARLALAILVLDRTHSASLSALVVAVSFLPWLGPGQVLATRLGHLHRIRVMVGADLVRAALFAVLLVPMPTWGLLALVLVASTATPPFETARSALTVDLVPPEHYGSALALLDLTDQSAIVIGYLVGGLSVLAGGASAALLVNVASFVVSAVVLVGVRDGHDRRPAEPVRSQLGRGVRIVWSQPVIRLCLPPPSRRPLPRTRASSSTSTPTSPEYSQLPSRWAYSSPSRSYPGPERLVGSSEPRRWSRWSEVSAAGPPSAPVICPAPSSATWPPASCPPAPPPPRSPSSPGYRRRIALRSSAWRRVP
jgi:hypothetical protein